MSGAGELEERKAFRDWAWMKAGEAIGNLSPSKAAEEAWMARAAASRAEVVALREALRGHWHGVFLDGRNDHGSHILRLPQRSIELEQDSNGDFLKGDAETVLRAAEAEGFRVGHHAVVLTFDLCLDDGFFSHYEFSGVSAKLTAALYGTPQEQDAEESDAALAGEKPVGAGVETQASALSDLAAWIDGERAKISGEDGYNYKSGEEYGLRRAQVEAARRAAISKSGEKP